MALFRQNSTALLQLACAGRFRVQPVKEGRFGLPQRTGQPMPAYLRYCAYTGALTSAFDVTQSTPFRTSFWNPGVSKL